MSEEHFAHTAGVELFYNSVMRELFWDQPSPRSIKAFNNQRDDFGYGE